MRSAVPRIIALLAGVASLASSSAAAQGYPPSQRGSVMQNVALTRIEVTYGRPVARGRALFGQLVPWDSVWHPGADSATKISFDHDVEIEGKPLKAGAYSLWLIPRRDRPWTIIFSRAAEAFHKPYPGAAMDALRVDVTPETASHVESLSIEFPMVLRDQAIMRIHWGTAAAPIRITAPSKPE
jgi:hypothetical protein